VKVFLDTNILVAAFATRGLCADVVRTVLAEHEWLVSETVLGELQRVLADKIGLPESGVRSIMRFVREQALVTAAAARAAPVEVRDPDDNAVLSDALDASAEVLVTGDRDLLELEGIPGLRILNPRGFWGLVTSAPDE
jgi:putative PIN family toxin of toxin-antitoxin system